MDRLARAGRGRAPLCWQVVNRTATGPRLFVLGLLLGGGCTGSGGGQGCVEVEVAGCTSAFDPTFTQVWNRVLEPSCTVPGTPCHGASDAAGAGRGLVLLDPDGAYDALFHGGFVAPGDPACSILVERLDTDDESRRMPVGEVQLAEGLRCGVRQWIAAGAPR